MKQPRVVSTRIVFLQQICGGSGCRNSVSTLRSQGWRRTGRHYMDYDLTPFVGSHMVVSNYLLYINLFSI
jgi:hypothetical protein